MPSRLLAVKVPGLDPEAALKFVAEAAGAAAPEADAGVMGRRDAAPAFMGLLEIAPRCTSRAPLSHFGASTLLLFLRPLRLLLAFSKFRVGVLLAMEAAAAAAEAGRILKSSSEGRGAR